MKTKVLKQIGYKITGTAIINLWGGGQGEIEMKSFKIDGLSDEKIKEGINDGGFGCESIDSVDVDIFELYENNYAEFLESRHYDTGISQKNIGLLTNQQ